MGSHEPILDPQNLLEKFPHNKTTTIYLSAKMFFLFIIYYHPFSFVEEKKVITAPFIK